MTQSSPRAMRTPPTPQQQPERVDWNDLLPEFLDAFEEGQHIAIIGPTGEGKTTFSVSILDEFHRLGASELFLANKNRDPLLTKLVQSGWSRITSWPPDYAQRQGRRVILWPSYGRASRAKSNRPIFEYALDMALLEGHWVVYFDEMRYFIEQMGMRSLVDEYWNGARSSGLTVIAASQGTTWINKTMIRQESWLVLFRPRSLEEMKEYADAIGDRDAVEDLRALKRHEFLLVHTPNGRRFISKLPVRRETARPEVRR